MPRPDQNRVKDCWIASSVLAQWRHACTRTTSIPRLLVSTLQLVHSEQRGCIAPLAQGTPGLFQGLVRHCLAIDLVLDQSWWPWHLVVVGRCTWACTTSLARTAS